MFQFLLSIMACTRDGVVGATVYVNRWQSLCMLHRTIKIKLYLMRISLGVARFIKKACLEEMGAASIDLGGHGLAL